MLVATERCLKLAQSKEYLGVFLHDKNKLFDLNDPKQEFNPFYCQNMHEVQCHLEDTLRQVDFDKYNLIISKFNCLNS